MKFLPPLDGGTYQQLALAIHQLAKGAGNNAGTFTLAASPATTTTVTDVNMSADAYILWFPLHANAAQVNINLDSPMYLSTRSNGSFVLTHVASAASDLNFAYTIMGA